ncbi:hypothetical protein ACFU8T_15310 [Sphingobacterium spiritivorum]|uniref:Bulb-type lectin domain-containing protein n=1 Tax=Sphingobacterium spiritivorum ATCC 33861 TaxID=525373 RepID=D7VJC0_SPHSI|nr:hypothetical protein [Sphingobacterium spiritivorum]EFK58973.1 hypothetical protein HMPREF0766_11089 [Sphingobacterium spiritivorum ATCC 33861]QQT36834.1 hypothetical protein I6J01_05245 [Sphingobacterium spiritivorum]WQD33591.1 hypothetical protein U0038_18955 [Sphingobacterium spiritivorum]SUJ25284.1 D-mannose binding lectin [Sphingobacterium spiritivorum]
MKTLFFLFSCLVCQVLCQAQISTVKVDAFELYKSISYENQVIVDLNLPYNEVKTVVYISRDLIGPDYNKYEDVDLKIDLIYRSSSNSEIILSSINFNNSSFTTSNIYAEASLFGNLFSENIALNFQGNPQGNPVGEILIKVTNRKQNNQESYPGKRYSLISKSKIPSIFEREMPAEWKKAFIEGGQKIGEMPFVDMSVSFYASDVTPVLTSEPGKNRVYSKNGRYWLELQDDGHLILYEKLPNFTAKIKWQSNSYQSQRGLYSLVFQSDGNLVIYRKNVGSIWAAKITYIKPYVPNADNYVYGFWTLQDDGNFVLYYPYKPSINQYRAICSTGSGMNGVSKHFGLIK